MSEQKAPSGQGEWFIVQPRPAAKLAFEEWEGKVEPIASRTLVDIPECVICGARHAVCNDSSNRSGGRNGA